MGDLSNMYELDRFLRSAEGQGCLDETRQALLGRTIEDISFSNEGSFIATILHLDDGNTFFVAQASLDVGAIREQFDAVLEREYYRDFPDRKPAKHPTP